MSIPPAPIIYILHPSRKIAKRFMVALSSLILLMTLNLLRKLVSVGQNCSLFYLNVQFEFWMCVRIDTILCTQLLHLPDLSCHANSNAV